MQQQGTDRLEFLLSEIENLSAEEMIEILENFGIIRVKYLGDEVMIKRKDKLREDFNV